MRIIELVGELYLATERVFSAVEDWFASWVIPTLARLVFAGVLLVYFWGSAYTKLGEGVFGIFNLSAGAYAQIFPAAMEKVGYDPSQLSFFHTLVAIAGTWGEFILPFLLLIGLLTRLSALGMIGFIFVQSIVDISGHGLSAKAIGNWFDRSSDALIFDQRAFWVFLLLVIVLRGAGPFSVDKLLVNRST